MSNRQFKKWIKEPVSIAVIKYSKKITDLGRVHNIVFLKIDLKYDKAIYLSKFYTPSTAHEAIKICLHNENICNVLVSIELSRVWREMLNKFKNVI